MKPKHNKMLQIPLELHQRIEIARIFQSGNAYIIGVLEKHVPSMEELKKRKPEAVLYMRSRYTDVPGAAPLPPIEVKAPEPAPPAEPPPPATPPAPKIPDYPGPAPIPCMRLARAEWRYKYGAKPGDPEQTVEDVARDEAEIAELIRVPDLRHRFFRYVDDEEVADILERYPVPAAEPAPASEEEEWA